MHTFYEIRNQDGDSIMDPRAVFESGQMHRWEKEASGCYVIQAADRICRVSADGTQIEMTRDSDKSFWHAYFDLDTDYGAIEDRLITYEAMREPVAFGSGLRILVQPSFEAIVAFLISSNNNITRIRKSMEAIAFHYGTPLGEHFGRERYAFPTPQQLSMATALDLREKCGVGYRDTAVYEAAQKFADGTLSLDALARQDDATLEATLLSMRGIGQKVSDCIVLFGFHRMCSFPVDVWTKRALEVLIFPEAGGSEKKSKSNPKDKTKSKTRNKNKGKTKNQGESKPRNKNKASIQVLREKANALFGADSGYAQQYLFYYVRENQIRE